MSESERDTSGEVQKKKKGSEVQRERDIERERERERQRREENRKAPEKILFSRKKHIFGTC